MKLAYFAQDKDLLSPHVMQTRNYAVVSNHTTLRCCLRIFFGTGFGKHRLVKLVTIGLLYALAKPTSEPCETWLVEIYFSTISNRGKKC